MGKHTICILVDRLDASQLSYNIINCLNALNSMGRSVCLMYNDLADMPFDSRFSILSMRELWNFKGIAIATCEHTAKQVENALFCEKKYFYISDFFWTKNKNFSQDDYITYYGGRFGDIEPIASDEILKTILEKVLNISSKVVEDLYPEQLIKLIETQNDRK